MNKQALNLLPPVSAVGACQPKITKLCFAEFGIESGNYSLTSWPGYTVDSWFVVIAIHQALNFRQILEYHHINQFTIAAYLRRLFDN